MSREVRLVLDQLYNDLQTRPLDFVESRYTLIDKKAKIEYWLGNGLLFYGVYRPVALGFGLVGCVRFAFMLRKWRAATVIYRSRMASHCHA
jgi:hypothetical protein